MLPVYALTLLISAVLLFSIQPMVGKMLLPSLGGTPAVWNTCVVFFQALLLLGYGYAYVSSRFLKPRMQVIAHLLVLWLPLLLLPIHFGSEASPPSEGNPTPWLLAQLALVVGLPFWAVSSNAPLLQRWFAHLGHADAKDPYFLYAFSNLGSLAALLGYPLLVEPLMATAPQSQLWQVGYIALIVMAAVCGWLLWRSPQVIDERHNDVRKVEPKEYAGVTWLGRWHWVALAAVPSSLMLGVTTYITTDIASMPLLWVLPLALYLTTFILAFARRPLVPHRWMVKAFPYLVLLMALLVFSDVRFKPWLMAPIHLLAFFVVAMVCHGELARRRPPAERLTEFYFLMSLGGVLGGAFNALLAPNLFNSVAEYPLMLVAACFLRPALDVGPDEKRINRGDFLWPIALAAAAAGLAIALNWWDVKNRMLESAALFGVPVLVCFTFAQRPLRFGLAFAVVTATCAYAHQSSLGEVLYAQRGFFGVNRVVVDPQGEHHQLINGRTLHGLQRVGAKADCEPLAYFHRTGPIGDVFAAFENDPSKKRIGVIGLGAGSIASFARPDQHFTFYEIDPVVVRVATDPQYFGFLENCRGECDIVLGDARIQLKKARPKTYDLFILDAFSSDSIPAHLLTREALQLYMDKLSDEGALVMHISNKFLDLEPLLASLAKEQGLVCLTRSDDVQGDYRSSGGKFSSRYVAMARRTEHLASLNTHPKWKALSSDRPVRVWTDDYSNLLGVFRW